MAKISLELSSRLARHLAQARMLGVAAADADFKRPQPAVVQIGSFNRSQCSKIAMFKDRIVQRSDCSNIALFKRPRSSDATAAGKIASRAAREGLASLMRPMRPLSMNRSHPPWPLRRDPNGYRGDHRGTVPRWCHESSGR
jgi:hypothetical protein